MEDSSESTDHANTSELFKPFSIKRFCGHLNLINGFSQGIGMIFPTNLLNRCRYFLHLIRFLLEWTETESQKQRSGFYRYGKSMAS